MVALAEGKPKTLGLKAMLKYYVEHQKEVVTRKTKRELEIAEKKISYSRRIYKSYRNNG